MPVNSELTFEWDEDKARRNEKKHGISFVDAVDVFVDPHRLERIDDRDDHDEERYQVIAMASGRVLFVVHTERGNVYRIISARKATPDEEAAYYAHHP